MGRDIQTSKQTGREANITLAVKPEQLVDNSRMPPLGNSFGAAMEECGYRASEEKDFICHLLSKSVTYPIRRPEKKKNKGNEQRFEYLETVPGHMFDGATGPRKADVMVIGKMPGYDEVQEKRNMTGEAGMILRGILNTLDIHYSSWYVTNVSKVFPSDKKLKAHHIKEFAYLLHQEIEIVDPKYILVLGSEALKFLFPRFSLKNVRGAELDYYGRKCFITNSPAALLHSDNPTLQPAFEEDIRIFTTQTICDKRPEPMSTKYYYMYDQETLSKAVDQLIDSGFKKFAVDCEWAGNDYMTGRLRTIQVSWAPGRALVVVLTNENQEDCFTPNRFSARDALNRLLCREGVKVCGHNIRADLPWLIEFGLAGVVSRVSFDTILAQHVLREAAPLDLNTMAVHMTDLGRYDVKLEQWKKENGISKKEGYGRVPDDLLLLYGAQDADATFRLWDLLDAELNLTENAQFKRLFYNVIMPSTEAVLEIEMTGLHVDADRMKELVVKYGNKRDELVNRIRTMTGRKDFSARSYLQIQDLIFGEYNLQPIKTTKSAGSLPWYRYESQCDGVPDFSKASTDKETLGILATEHPELPVLPLLRDVKFIDQIVKNFLRPPDSVADDYSFGDDEDEEYSEGLLGIIMPDGRIRPRLSQLAVTGRWKCFQPNLQNIPKRRERDYDRIFEPMYVPKVRSCFVAKPGYVLLEADYKQAELFCLAWQSGDKNLLDALMTAGRDLHSETAKKAFNLADCFIGIRDGEFVDEVAEKHPSLRVAAKTINFGIAYQRGAEAIAREILQEGIQITVAQAKAGIDAFYEMYPDVYKYIQWCALQIRTHWWIDSSWGRRRRFAKTDDEYQISKYGREGCNHPIQGAVADALNVAVANIMNYRKSFRLNGEQLDFKIVLAVHDAVVLEVHPRHVEHVAKVMLPQCMSDNCVIPKLNQKLDIDIELGFRWSEPATTKSERGLKIIEGLLAAGVPETMFKKEAA